MSIIIEPLFRLEYGTYDSRWVMKYATHSTEFRCTDRYLIDIAASEHSQRIDGLISQGRFFTIVRDDPICCMTCDLATAEWSSTLRASGDLFGWHLSLYWNSYGHISALEM